MAKVLLRFFLLSSTRYVLAWLVAVSVAGITLFFCWRSFDSAKHPDGSLVRPGGNNGHTMIDFGGQWLMGRMLAKRLGEHLYHRAYQREVLREAYPREDEIPDADRPAEEVGRHEAD